MGKHHKLIFTSVIPALLLFSCRPYPESTPNKPVSTPQPIAAENQSQPSATLQVPTKQEEAPIKFEPKPVPSKTAPAAQTGPTTAHKQDPFPLSEPGNLQVGRLEFVFHDPNRGNREIAIIVWYPALLPEDLAGGVFPGATPDLSNAPYPFVLSSAKTAGQFAPHLVSHGFSAAGIRNLNFYEPWNQNLVDQPRDFLFVLDQLGKDPPEVLESLIDVNHTGILGYSFDGYNALALSGARIDPAFYFEQCANAPSHDPPLSDWRVWHYCDLTSHWDEFRNYAGEDITASTDVLRQALTDDRIRAVIPMAPEGSWLFGERGLAAADRPVLVIAGTEDKGDHNCPYDMEAAPIFERLGAPHKILLSFVGEGHSMIFKPAPLASMKHFAIAFFGYHLLGRADYIAYFSEESVNKTDGIFWGIYPGE
jgi:predicted dienelactone hydrolase